MAIVKDMIEQRRRSEPNISEEKLALFGRKMFAQLAIDTADGRAWARQQMVRHREMKVEMDQGRLGLARTKFALDAAELCLEQFEVIEAAVKDARLSRCEKIERVHQVLSGI